MSEWLHGVEDLMSIRQENKTPMGHNAHMSFYAEQWIFSLLNHHNTYSHLAVHALG
jgi:hypothetical protein